MLMRLEVFVTPETLAALERLSWERYDGIVPVSCLAGCEIDAAVKKWTAQDFQGSGIGVKRRMRRLEGPK